jgi:MFS transporter, OPA family, glycerol-3-phosphate transporter
MAESVGASFFVPHPPGFRAQRGLNWGFVGLLYTSFYMCRYNLPVASGAISSEFGFSKAQIGAIITTALLAYACGLILNGLLADRFGGKRAMLIAAAATIIMNILFGVASFWGLLWLFVVIRGIDGYMQAFGAPGMVKINAAWFRHTERGSFAGIFGFMINLGRFGIFKLGPALLAGFTFLGLIRIPPVTLALAILGSGRDHTCGRHLHGFHCERHTGGSELSTSGSEPGNRRTRPGQGL